MAKKRPKKTVKKKQINQPSYFVYKKKKHHNPKVQAVLNFFKFDSHGVMRRHILQFGMATFALLLGFGFGIHHNYEYEVNKAKTLTNYKSSVTFSKTNNTSLKLRHTQIASNRKTAYVPFQFSDMSQVSSDANKYTILVGGALQRMAPDTMTGQLILFSSTGRGVILLHSAHRIANKPIVVIMRSNSDLGSGNGGSDDEVDTSAKSDGTGIAGFENEFNALHFKINPGATRTKVNPKLKTSDKLSTIYRQLFGIRDLQTYYKDNRSARKKIKIANNQSKEYSKRLRSFGFRLPVFKGKAGYGPGHHLPAWMNPKWRPYDYIMKDGIPRNKKGKANPKDVKRDAASSPVNNETDDVDNMQFPASLKKKDGTTTSDAPNTAGSSGGDGGDSNSDENTNGGSVEDPSTIWNDLQQAWDEVLNDKHAIYSINAADIFKTKATIQDVNLQSSVGSKKHFKQAN